MVKRFSLLVAAVVLLGCPARAQVRFLYSPGSLHVQFAVEAFDGRIVVNNDTYREIELLSDRQGCIFTNRAVFPRASDPKTCVTFSSEHSTKDDLLILQRDFDHGIVEFEWEEVVSRMRGKLEFTIEDGLATVKSFKAEQVRRNEAFGGVAVNSWRLPEKDRQVTLPCGFVVRGR